MAKSTKSTPSKARAGGKSKQRTSAKKSAPRKSRGAQARTASKRAARKQTPQAETWAASIGSLLSSQPGREILADVLDAAAGVLRRNREITQQVVASGEAALESGRDLATAAFRASTSAADEMTSAARGMAETAAERLAELAGDTVRTILPQSSSASDAGGPETKGGGKRKAGG